MAQGRVQVRVSGRVQGVYYRASAQAKAEGLGLAGWVRNREDGSVELVAEGPRERLETLVAWCHLGPPAARVREVEVEWGESTGAGGGFEVRP